jgi:hypothetical protein
MIWRFEGGPWDGKQIELHDNVLVPMFQVVSLLGQEPLRYDLAEKQEPATFIYRPTKMLDPFGSEERSHR